MSNKLQRFPFGITIAALLLFAPSVFPIGDVSAQNIDYSEQFVHDVQVPLPDQVGPDVYLPEHDLPTSPPINPQVGDSWIWWLWGPLPTWCPWWTRTVS